MQRIYTFIASVAGITNPSGKVLGNLWKKLLLTLEMLQFRGDRQREKSESGCVPSAAEVAAQ